MRPLNILQLNKFYPPHFGGIERMVETYSDCLARRGHRVQVLTFKDHGMDGQVDRSETNPAVSRVTPLARIHNVPFAFSFLARLRKLARAADMIHIHEPFPSGLVGTLTLSRTKPVVVSWHADVVRLGPLRPALEMVQRRLLDRAATILCASQAIVDASPVASSYREKVKVVPLGLSIDRFLESGAPANGAAIEAIRARVGRPFVLAVGRLVPYKGYGVLLESVARSSVTVAIIGAGPLEAELKAEAQRAGIADRVHFAGLVSDGELPLWYRAATAYTMPSVTRAEAFGLAQVEAMASGLPVVNTSLPTAVPEVSLDGISGLTVQPGDADALARALERLMGDAGLRRRFADAGIARAKQHFAIERVIDRVEQTYFDALDAGDRRSRRIAEPAMGISRS